MAYPVHEIASRPLAQFDLIWIERVGHESLLPNLRIGKNRFDARNQASPMKFGEKW